MAKGVQVFGIQVNLNALDRAGDINVEGAGAETAKQLAPKVSKNVTRIETGRYRGAWVGSGSYLINPVSYAGYQEFGTATVSADMALARTMGTSGYEIVHDVFEKEQERAAKVAGW